MPVCIGRIESLKQRRQQCLEIDGHSLLLVYQSDHFYLLDNRCPHKSASLCEGRLQGLTIECPWHDALFDLETGRGLTPVAGKGIQRYPLFQQNGDLLAELPDIADAIE